MKKSSLFDAMMSEIDIANAAVHVARERQARLEWEMHDVQAKFHKAQRDLERFMAMPAAEKGNMCARFSDALWDDIHAAISSNIPVHLKFDVARGYLKDMEMRTYREKESGKKECVAKNLKLLDRALAGYRVAKYSNALSELSRQCNDVTKEVCCVQETLERTMFHRLAGPRPRAIPATLS